MARQNIAALLGNTPKVEEPEAPSQPVEEAKAADSKPTRPKASKPVAKPIATETSAPAKKEPSPIVGEPFYLTFERKETRLRPDQYADLIVHARRLNKAKGTGGERITENTLIRIAIDLLMPHLGQAAGHDEAEIRNSVSSELR